MERLVEILRKAVSDGASDIFIVAGGALSYKVDGDCLLYTSDAADE